LLVFGIAGCGKGESASGSGSSSNEKELTAIATNEEPEGGVVGVLSVSEVENLGSIVIDRGNHVVYVFDKDKGSTSSCYDACAVKWPPLLTESNPIVRDGIDPERVGTTERKDGKLQVTFDGMPLYGFLDDENPYEANGNGVKAFGGEWSALQPNGQKPED